MVAFFLFDEKNIAAAFSRKIQFEFAAKDWLKAAPLAQSLPLTPAVKAASSVRATAGRRFLSANCTSSSKVRLPSPRLKAE